MLQESRQEMVVAGAVGEHQCRGCAQMLWSQPLGLKACLDPLQLCALRRLTSPLCTSLSSSVN